MKEKHASSLRTSVLRHCRHAPPPRVCVEKFTLPYLTLPQTGSAPHRTRQCSQESSDIGTAPLRRGALLHSLYLECRGAPRIFATLCGSGPSGCGVARVAPPLAPSLPCVCGEIYLTAPHRSRAPWAWRVAISLVLELGASAASGGGAPWRRGARATRWRMRREH